MYDYAEKHGAKFPTPDTQTFSRSAAGQAFRDARSANPNRQVTSFGGGGGDYLVQVNHNYKFNQFKMEDWPKNRSEEHTSELQSLMRISYAVFCLKKKKYTIQLNKKKIK